MKALTSYILLLLCMLLLGACKEEEYVYPSVRTEFIDIQTDNEGTISELVADNGERYPVQFREGISGLRPDTLYRTVSVYSLPSPTNGNAEVQLYSSQLILSPYPVPASQIKDEIKTDPVDIQSIWHSGNYLNLILLVQKKDQQHTYHFMDEGIQTSDDGIRTLNLRLYHNSNNDYEAFTTRVYLSVPLQTYEGKLRPGDRIRFHLHTYKEGETWRDFTF